MSASVYLCCCGHMFIRLLFTIRKCKDYYEILGVAKDCSEDDLKKAYKKLALKFHPDKNKAPGATEAFKAIGNALAVLTDTEKRRRYDQFGAEADRVPRHSHGNYEYDYSRGFEGDISAEELFNMFFGGAFQPGHSRRMNTRHSHTRTQFNTNFQDRSEQPYALLLQLSPILFMILLSLISSLLMSDPFYSLQPDHKYSHERRTHNLAIPYYVKPGFSTDYKGSIRQLEQSVEEDYLSTLRSNCFRERSYKENMLWRARNFHDSRLYQKAQDMKTPSCDRLQNIYSGG
ncbi:DnaJ-like protein subfamily B member 14 [Lamellibrachia satsuma]|nr:DnaJ-like protein subfamily B member 14 [Lamellibrachia satsuma]